MTRCLHTVALASREDMSLPDVPKQLWTEEWATPPISKSRPGKEQDAIDSYHPGGELRSSQNRRTGGQVPDIHHRQGRIWRGCSESARDYGHSGDHRGPAD